MFHFFWPNVLVVHSLLFLFCFLFHFVFVYFLPASHIPANVYTLNDQKSDVSLHKHHGSETGRVLFACFCQNIADVWEVKMSWEFTQRDVYSLSV